MPCSSMVERAAVNREAIGSSPIGAANPCRVDDWQVAATLNRGEVGSTPTPASIALWCNWQLLSLSPYNLFSTPTP